MNREKPEWEINIKSMIFAAAYRWKAMVAVAMILAVLLGGYQTLSLWRNTGNSAVAEQNEAAQAEHKSRSDMLQTSIKNLKKNIKEQEIYLSESVLMQLDYWNVHQAKVDLYVSTPYQIMPDKFYQDTDKSSHIVALYASALQDPVVLEKIAADVKIKATYLSELITVKTEEDNILSVTVNWTDDEGAQKIANALITHAQSCQDAFAEKVGEHTLEVALNTVGSFVDPTLIDQQNAKNFQMQNYEQQLAEKEAKLQTLAAPTISAVSVGDILKAGIKWAILGCVAGLFLTFAYFCFIYIFSDKVYSGTDLQNRCGIRALGSLSGSKKYDPITRCLHQAEGRVIAGPDAAPELLQETLLQYAQGASNVLITGDVKPELAKACADRLQEGMGGVKLIPCGSVLEDADAVRGLKQCDAVVLLEKCGTSRYHRISREIARINDTKKPLMGCIIVER